MNNEDIERMKEFMEPIKRLKKDIRESAGLMNPTQIRYLVDFYYQIQDFRIQAAAQIRSMNLQADIPEPVNVIEWIFESQRRIEESIKGALDVYSDCEPTGMGAWAKSIIGIGPVISSGLCAHINLEPWKCIHFEAGKKKKPCNENIPCEEGGCHHFKVQTVGGIWRFAGLDPTSKWERKTRRPWNAKLKVLCWKAGESFIKVQNNPKDVYGKLYVKRKAEEQAKNESGEFKDQADIIIKEKKIGKTTEAFKWYSKGMLPPAHIHARARRWAVKIFLYHWFAEAYRRKWNEEAPKPYVIEHMGHAHLI